MNPADETVLARFAAGEMSVAEEANFLSCCESQPEHWRTAALALVEHRHIVVALREYAGVSSAPSASVAGVARGDIQRRRPAIPVIAASLVIVILGGLWAGYWAGRFSQPGVERGVSDLPDGTSEQEDLGVIVYVQAPTGNELNPERDVPSPRGPWPAGGARFASIDTRPVFPGEARSLLRQEGLEVKEEPVLYILDDSDGRRWAVPSRDFQLRYVDHQH